MGRDLLRTQSPILLLNFTSLYHGCYHFLPSASSTASIAISSEHSSIVKVYDSVTGSHWLHIGFKPIWSFSRELGRNGAATGWYLLCPGQRQGSMNCMGWTNHCTIARWVWKGWRGCEAKEALDAELKSGGQQEQWELLSSGCPSQGTKGLNSLIGWCAGQQLPQDQDAGGQGQPWSWAPTRMSAAPQHPRQLRQAGWWWQQALMTDWWAPDKNCVTVQGQGQARKSKQLLRNNAGDPAASLVDA